MIIIKQQQHLWKVIVPIVLVISRSTWMTFSVFWLPKPSYFSIPTSSSPSSSLYLLVQNMSQLLASLVLPFLSFNLSHQNSSDNFVPFLTFILHFSLPVSPFHDSDHWDLPSMGEITVNSSLWDAFLREIYLTPSSKKHYHNIKVKIKVHDAYREIWHLIVMEDPL